MAERAALFMLSADGTRASWRVGGQSHTGPLSALTACGASAYVWLVDSRCVQLTEAELPPGNRRVQAQALPYALEDQILTPVDELGFATHRLSATHLACAVFATEPVERQLDALTAAGLAVVQCVPDVLCTPWQASTWTLVFDGDDAWLRTGPYAGLRCAGPQWRAFVEQALVGIDGEQHVRVHGADDARLAALAAVSPALVVDAVTRGPGTDMPALFAEGHAQGHLIDLLAALPQRRAAGAGASRRWWWATAAVVLIAALAHAAFMQWHVGTLERRWASEQANTEGLFRTMFPTVTRIEDVRVQATQALADAAENAAQGPPFLDLLAAVGQQLAAQGANDLSFESVNYGNGALELRVLAKDMAALERYQQALAAAALPVQLLSVENRDARAVGLLRVGQSR